MRVMVNLGVPYSEDEIVNAQANMKEQAAKIESNLMEDPTFAENYESDKKEAEAMFPGLNVDGLLIIPTCQVTRLRSMMTQLFWLRC